MSFALPTFNLVINIWHSPPPMPLPPPDIITVGNLAWGKRVASPASGGTSSIGTVFTCPILLLPKGTDIRSIETTLLLNDTVEVPAGTGRLYSAIYVEDIGKGFPNEHRGAMLLKLAPWPIPIP